MTAPPSRGAGSPLSLALGTLLILLGGLAWLGQTAGVEPLAWFAADGGWPFIVIGSGLQVAAVGLAVFLRLAAFFELLLNVSGLVAGGVAGVALPLLLIGLGALVLVRRGQRGGGA